MIKHKYDQQYYLKNRDKIIERNKLWQINNRHKRHEYYWNNRERFHEYYVREYSRNAQRRAMIRDNFVLKIAKVAMVCHKCKVLILNSAPAILDHKQRFHSY